MAQNMTEKQRSFNAEFGIRLEAVRMHLGLKKEEMAEKLGIAGATYSQAIRGQSMPSTHRIESIVDLGISSDWLFFGKLGNMPKDIENSLVNYALIAEENIRASNKPRE